jgi:hypothetical protein
MHRLNDTLKTLLVAIVLAHAAGAAAQMSSSKPGIDLDSKTIAVQAKAEELFDREDYRRAYTIYLKDLAPIGDKYAQYMLGFMSGNGLGVDQDPVVASAWYRLAAERGEPPQFVAVRNDVLDQLDSDARARSDQVYLQLCGEFSDIAISMREVQEEFGNLSRVSTGSRVGGSSSLVTIVEPRAGGSQSGDAFVRRAKRRMQGHLDNVTAMLGVDRIDAEQVTASELAALEETVRDYILSMADR